MVSTMFNKGAIPVLEQVLYFTSLRHDAIANNIANAETPGYRAVDAPQADFEEAMRRAIEARDEQRIPVFRFEGYGAAKPREGGGLSLEFVERDPSGILRHIENNVDVDLEMGALVKNAMKHNLAAGLLAHQFTLLREAVAERVGG